MRIGDRVVVRRVMSRKYGTVVNESRDKLCWVVLLDGNRQTINVEKRKCELLRPEQLAFYFGDKGRRA